MINDDASVIEPTHQELRTNFMKHKTRPIAFRKQQLRNLLNGIKQMKEELYAGLQKDLGYRNRTQCEMMQFQAVISHIEHDISHVEQYNQRRSVGTTLGVGPGKSYIVPEPRGVVLVMGAWNYPLFTLLPAVSTCIAAGNAVILKPSELSPHTSNNIAKLFKTYMDNSVYRVIEGGVQVAINITKQPLDLIFFVGGTEKGKLVAKAAADNLVPCILELGGKSPCIVDGSGDLNMVARRIIQTKYANCGQTCVAPDYLLVPETQKDRIIDLLKTTLVQFFGQAPIESEYVSRMVNDFHCKRVIECLSDHGGQIIVGGKYNANEKWIEPTIILNPSPNSKLMKEEIFGPILPIITYKDNDEMISFINNRHKPLSLYYYGNNGQIKERIINETSSGGICINDCLFHSLNPDLPFGGVGYSGYGSINGQIGFDQCCHLKAVLEKSTLDPSARYPPYDSTKTMILTQLFKHGNITQHSLLYKLIIGIMIAIILGYVLKCQK